MTAHSPPRLPATLAARSASVFTLLAALACQARAEVPAPLEQAYPGTIVLNVDATNVGQQIFRMRVSTRSTISRAPSTASTLAGVHVDILPSLKD